MIRRTLLSMSALAVFAAVPTVMQAQTVCVGINSCSLNPTASLTIPKLVLLELSSATITLNTPTFASDSLDDQETATTVTGINVRANHAWTLAISSAATDWTYTPAAGAAGGARVRADLLFQVNCAGGYSTLSGTGVTVASGAVTDGASASVCLRTDFPADYASVKNRPGTYTLALTLTLAAS